MNDAEIRPCRLCGREIEIRFDARGKRIALEKVRAFYALATPDAGGDLRKLELAAGVAGAFVDHAETCSRERRK